MFRRASRPAAPTPGISHPLTPCQLPWLLALATLVLLPHVDHLSSWLSVTSGCVLLWRGWLWHRQLPLPHRYLLAALTLAGCAGIALDMRGLFGRDNGVALLTLLLALKVMESRQRRDALAVILLSLFLLLTHFFYSQSIPTALWLLLTLTVLVATLLRLFGDARQPVQASLRQAGSLLLQALPFLLVLFLLVPRVNGPLWGQPAPAQSQTGLSDQMSPGSVSNLIRSGAIAFRAEFHTPPPPQHDLYWRGPVFDQFSEGVWQASGLMPSTLQALSIQPVQALVTYTLTLEPHNQRWLLPLGLPTQLLPGTSLTPDAQFQRREPVRERLRLTLTTAPGYRFNARGEHPLFLQQATQLPPDGNPRSRALARQWLAETPAPAALAERILRHFRQQPFHYTLQPPLLGADSVDEFLFDTRQGFCEHYASSFVFLLRAAGVPARVVTGYQGGEWNPLDQTLVVRQSDAHAWAEVWLAGEGWVRYDPTSAVSPERVEQGIAAALPEGDALPFAARVDLGWLTGLRQQWEAANHRWNRWVLGYNPERQKEFLSLLGLDTDWRSLVALLTSLCGAVLLTLLGWQLWRWRHPQQRDPVLLAWQAWCRQLGRHGIHHQPWEGPAALARRCAEEQPDFPALAANASTAATSYITLRYAAPPDPQARRRALQQLRQSTLALKKLRRPAPPRH